MRGEASTDIERLIAHVELFCEHDARGRLVDGRRQAPRFWLGRSVLGNVWRFAAALDEDRVREIGRVIAREPGLEARPGQGSVPEAERAARIRTLLERDAPIEGDWRGPTFFFPPERAGAAGRDARIRALDASEIALLEPHFPERAAALADPVRQPWLAWIEDGVAIGWCRTGCGDPARVVEASVEVAPSARGRGIAREVVAAWAAEIRARGGTPLYSTEWTNTASRAVARKLGLVAYGDSWHVR